MDLDHAFNAHSQWKVKLRTAAKDKQTLDATTINRDDCCDMGRWLHSEAREKFGTTAVYKQLVRRHALFHAAAGKVAEVINAGRFDEANRMLDGADYAYASTQVGIAIIQLKKTAARAIA